jgi:hypothetical protein
VTQLRQVISSADSQQAASQNDDMHDASFQRMALQMISGWDRAKESNPTRTKCRLPLPLSSLPERFTTTCGPSFAPSVRHCASDDSPDGCLKVAVRNLSVYGSLRLRWGMSPLSCNIVHFISNEEGVN